MISTGATSTAVGRNQGSKLTIASRTGAQWGVDDPTLMVSAAAAVTKNLTFGITHSVTYGQWTESTTSAD
jgi:alkanesulfonate monooxygenase SsuD/methylene tetrahydromethanopterin reductase-like flavin-dependent oxidoreductase (luciferase family)